MGGIVEYYRTTYWGQETNSAAKHVLDTAGILTYVKNNHSMCPTWERAQLNASELECTTRIRHGSE